jgi:predicted hotdog family 3-hydroxylacyl-ACP dehydratase
VPLNKSAIAELIPHSGPMCLLDEVTRWDARSIRAASRTHLAADNPLRSAGGIPALSAVEYAAQAMAAHGALAGSIDGRPRAGYLVSLRGVACTVASLDGLEGDLTVDAEHVAGDAERVMYAFRVAVGDREVLSGKATVVLDAAPVER